MLALSKHLKLKSSAILSVVKRRYSASILSIEDDDILGPTVLDQISIN